MVCSSRGCGIWQTVGLLLILGFLGCSGGGGDGNDANDVAPENTVTIQGLAHQGAPAVPLGLAFCQFIDASGTQQAQAMADEAGVFFLRVPPAVQGRIRCTPPALDRLELFTITDTLNATSGSTIPATGREAVSPQTTIVAALIAQEDPTDPQTRKAQLLAAIAAQDPTIAPLAEAAAVLFQQLLAAQANVGFGGGAEGNDGGGDDAGGGSGDPGDAGAVSGDVGDGADLSPIPGAVCKYVLELGGEALRSSLLHDLADGQIDRPDLQAVADQVNQALGARASMIAAAFNRRFPDGIGRPIRTTASDENAPTPGRYVLRVPPNVPGYVECHPPEHEDLILATFTGPRRRGADLAGQFVNPATTIFSTHIAAMLVDNLAVSAPIVLAAKEDFLNDIAGLQVGVDQSNGEVDSYRVIGPVNHDDADARLIAFTATAIYATLFKRNINGRFLDVMRIFVSERRGNPERLEESLAEADIPAAQTRRVANIVNTSTEAASAQLGTNVDIALSAARIRVRVRARRRGEELRGASVTLVAAPGNVTCTNCPQLTDQEGEATLTFANVPSRQGVPITLGATRANFQPQRIQRNIVALARVTADFQLEPADAPTGSGGGSDR